MFPEHLYRLTDYRVNDEELTRIVDEVTPSLAVVALSTTAQEVTNHLRVCTCILFFPLSLIFKSSLHRNVSSRLSSLSVLWENSLIWLMSSLLLLPLSRSLSIVSKLMSVQRLQFISVFPLLFVFSSLSFPVNRKEYLKQGVQELEKAKKSEKKKRKVSSAQLFTSSLTSLNHLFSLTISAPAFLLLLPPLHLLLLLLLHSASLQSLELSRMLVHIYASFTELSLFHILVAFHSPTLTSSFHSFISLVA